MKLRTGLLSIFLSLHHLYGFAQPDVIALYDADSVYIRKYVLLNDVRLFYGGQGNNISLGTKRNGETQLNGDVYTNTNDYIGVGLTYKWLDGDLSFALPGTTYLKEDRSNLTQFKLSMSYTMRSVIFRGYYTESKGMVISDAADEFESTPSIHEEKMGVQITWLFNPARYSYRAAMYQSEVQMKTAGSFLFRVEPFYRNLGGQSGSMIPATYDTPELYGDQVGLEYIKAPGVLFMPGYGITIVIPNSKIFISPMAFAGVGAAFNSYRSKNGDEHYTNAEYAANFNLNMGYNGSRYYSRIQFSYVAGYTPLNPSYFTTTNLMLVLTTGIRFGDVEKFISRSF